MLRPGFSEWKKEKNLSPLKYLQQVAISL